MNVAQIVSLLLGVLLVLGVLFLFLPARTSRAKADRPVFRDDDRYWVGGFLYNNPDDPSVVVPKRYSGGYTLNVGHPLGRLIMIGMVLLILLLALLGVLAPGFSSYGCHPSGCHF